MSDKLSRFSKKYAGVLKRFVAHQEESLLEEAYELGRKAISEGLGVLDMVKAHQEAIVSLTPSLRNGEPGGKLLRSAEAFFLEALSPFEAAHRGFREANQRLLQLNDALAARNEELARTNRELETEITERERVERALRDSEEHYRQLFQEARRMEENLRHLSNQIINVQEEERKRISRDLHDEVGQALTAVNVVLAMLRSEAGDQNLQRKIAETQNLLVTAMDTMHRFARELRPAMLDDLGIIPALRSYLKGWTERTGIPINFSANPKVEEMDGSQKTVLYRVAQESLTNVAKHAQATRVEVSIRCARNQVEMVIADNGKAASAAQIAGKKRLGLLGMQERARLVNGIFEFDSRPGQGTTIRVQIPVKDTTPSTPRIKRNINPKLTLCKR